MQQKQRSNVRLAPFLPSSFIITTPITPYPPQQFKRILLETNPYYLALTFSVSLLHTAFDMLAFKNDIGFWKDNKSMKGLSARTIVIQAACQLVVFLYLLDNREDTSYLVIFSQGLALLIEFWKITKAMNVSSLLWVLLFCFTLRFFAFNYAACTPRGSLCVCYHTPLLNFFRSRLNTSPYTFIGVPGAPPRVPDPLPHQVCGPRLVRPERDQEVRQGGGAVPLVRALPAGDRLLDLLALVSAAIIELQSYRVEEQQEFLTLCAFFFPL
jgi:hypothetical protein